MFKKRENVVEIEEGNLLSPKFDNDGLIPVITMCSKTKDILMHGYMNVEALKKLLKRKKLTTLVDLEKLFGIREKQVDLLKKLRKLELMMIKTLFGLQSI
jgi:phosphoribosyl-AMP cyclohydrolase